MNTGIALNKILSILGQSDREKIEDIIAGQFIVDFGVVDAWPSVVGGSSRVDVDHAIQPFVAGQQMGTTVTKGVEILWPGGGGQYSEKWDLAKGDPLLLVGLKDFVDTVASGLPSIPDYPMHYCQETMKAIPMGAFKSSTITLQMTGGKWQLQATEIDLNGSAHPLVMGDTLQTLITAWIVAFQAALTGAGVAAVIPGLDITTAKTTTLKTGG